MYVPGGKGRTCKERAKQNRKLLFGSAPLKNKFHTHEKDTSINPLPKPVSPEPPRSQESHSHTEKEVKCVTRVSFRERLTNGSSFESEVGKEAPLAKEESESPEDAEEPPPEESKEPEST
ncbi:hypothetical protein NQ318_019973, partial [Aromia moschata]